jgi:CheY-like chemotaxis protein
MPEMNGVQFTTEVRALQNEGLAREATKIILTSGQKFQEGFEKVKVKNRMIDLFDEQLQKPFIIEELEKALIKVRFN